jgi:iron complex outermembrane receptor protein
MALGVDAQTIKGIVKDAKSAPVIGASIVQKGINNGTTTNAQGEFTLQLKAAASSQIIVSFVGYSSKIVDTKGNSSLQIVLEEDNQQLNEVVVVGSRSAQNRTVTNSVVPVDLISLKDIQTTNPLLNVNDILNYLVPAFNSNRQSASDGTEHIDPATLRGLGLTKYWY